jgi:hypothetical protein
VSKVSIMGGLEKKMDEATGEERWVGDAAQNNVFDPSAMEVVYQVRSRPTNRPGGGSRSTCRLPAC